MPRYRFQRKLPPTWRRFPHYWPSVCGIHDFETQWRSCDLFVIIVPYIAVISAHDQRNICDNNTRHKLLFSKHDADKHYIPIWLHWLTYLSTLWLPANQTPSILFIWSRYHIPNRRFQYRSIDYAGRLVICLHSMNLANLWRNNSVIITS